MKKRIYAILLSALSLLFAGVGIQKFYLGQVKRGVLYVLFFWTFIPYLLCVIDLLRFVFMSDEEFNLKYNKDYYAKENYYDNIEVVDAEYSYVDDTNNKEKEEDIIISNALEYYNSIDNVIKNIKNYEFASYVRQLNALFKDIIDKAREYDLDKNDNVKKDLSKMLDYNIPTTLKLINSYIDLEDSNMDNVNNVRKGIKESIIAVVEFLKNVLNKIYENDIMDINSDIDVLKATLKNNI